MSSTLDETMKTARTGVESVWEGTEHTLGTLSVLLKGANAAAELVAMLRGIDRDDGLAWFGLVRQRRPLRSLMILNAGVAAGAVAGVLLAPVSGASLRRALVRRTRWIQHEERAEMGAAEPKTEPTKPATGCCSHACSTEASQPAKSSIAAHPG